MEYSVLEISGWRGIVSWVLAALAFRGLPALIWGLFSRTKCRVLQNKLIIAGIYLSMVAVAHGLELRYVERYPWFVVGQVYYLLACCGIHGLVIAHNSFRLTRSSLMTLCGIMFLLLPAVALPKAAAGVVLVFGWDLMFSAYSFVVESYQSGRVSRRSDALAFLLVNPTLVYSDRGRELDAAESRRGYLTRLAVGAFTIGGGVTIAKAFPVIDQSLRDMDTLGSLPIPMMVLAGTALVVTTFLGYYLGHSGAASVHIACMGLLGWKVPERYHYPFLATSPLDFWRRWNIYLGSWLRRYIYWPLVLYWGRRQKKERAALIQGGALVTTFVASGLLHDFYTYCDAFSFPVAATTGFLFFGCGTACWQFTAGKVSLTLRVTPKMALAVMSRFSLAMLLGTMYWIMSGDGDGRMPPLVSKLLGVQVLGF